MSHYDEEWRDLTYKHAQEDRVESFLDKQAAKEKEVKQKELEEAHQRCVSWLDSHEDKIKDYEVQKGDPSWPEQEKIDADVSIGEPCKDLDEAVDKAVGIRAVHGHSPPNKYSKPLRSWSITIDVYDVLDAFDVSNPATAHAIKKLLCTGTRGLKDWETDLQEAIDSLEQAKKYPPVPF